MIGHLYNHIIRIPGLFHNSLLLKKSFLIDFMIIQLLRKDLRNLSTIDFIILKMYKLMPSPGQLGYLCHCKSIESLLIIQNQIQICTILF